MKVEDKESKLEEIEASHTLGGAVIHTQIRQSHGLRQTMPVLVVITEEGTVSKASSLLSYTLRSVSLTGLDTLCQFGLR